MQRVDMLGIGVPDGGSRAQRTGAVAETGDLVGQLLGGLVQSASGRQGAQLVGDGEQRGQVTGELDVQLLSRERCGNSAASAMVWTDLVRIGSYMGWPPA